MFLALTQKALQVEEPLTENYIIPDMSLSLYTVTLRNSEHLIEQESLRNFVKKSGYHANCETQKYETKKKRIGY